MVERNTHVKTAPERWQSNQIRFDLVISFDLRVYETIVECI